MDSTIHIKSLFPAQSLSYADWLHAFSNFQLVACWLHGKCKYSILSFLFAKYLVESAPETVYIKVCEVTNFYADILLYSALDVLLMLGTCWILDNSASEQSCVTRHLISGSLGTWIKLNCSAPSVTRLLLCARHVYTKLVKCVTLNCQTWSLDLTISLFDMSGKTLN